jgi:hypothetical protein
VRVCLVSFTIHCKLAIAASLLSVAFVVLRRYSSGQHLTMGNTHDGQHWTMGNTDEEATVQIEKHFKMGNNRRWATLTMGDSPRWATLDGGQHSRWATLDHGQHFKMGNTQDGQQPTMPW